MADEANITSQVNTGSVVVSQRAASGTITSQVSQASAITSNVLGTGATGGVNSFNSRVGDILPADDDYTWAQLDKTTSNIADITTKSHTSLTDVGSNTHAQLDTAVTNSTNHIANTSNPHSVTKSQVGLSNVDNTADADKPVSTAQATAIGVVQSDVNTHEARTDNPHSVTKSQVGLANADNTSDANKPVSSATQSALDLKAPIASPTFTGTVAGVTKSMVGLGNVDNTSDTNKPVSTAQATAIGVVQSDVDTHEARTDNPHSVTKSQVGLANADNTSDANKPISTATQTALDAKSGTGHTHALAAGATDVTSSAAELNILDGATLTTAELNHVDGVTSAIQGQIDGKAASSHNHTAANINSGTIDTARLGSGTASGSTFLRGDQTWATPGGGGVGDVVGPAASVDNEVPLFSGTGGKTLKRSTSTGIAKLASGVLSVVTAPTGDIIGTTDTQTLTNKTLALGSNTVSGTTAQFNTANTDGDFATLAGTETLTNKTINGSQLVNSSVTSSKLSTGAQYAVVATSQGTTSASYTDLTTAGPAVTVTIGANGLAWVSITADMQQVAGNYAAMAFAISGATTRAAATPYECFHQFGANNGETKFTYSVLVTGLAAGSTTFTMKYKQIVGGTATFLQREISVIPF